MAVQLRIDLGQHLERLVGVVARESDLRQQQARVVALRLGQAGQRERGADLGLGLVELLAGEEALGAVELDVGAIGGAVGGLHEEAVGALEVALCPREHAGEVEHPRVVLTDAALAVVEDALGGIELVVVDCT